MMDHDADLRPTVRTTCRICASPLQSILSLGALYLSDFPNHPDTRAHPPVPLHLMRCLNPLCGLVQLEHTTPPEWLYRNYWYLSGVNESMRAELHDVVESACRRVDLPRGATVVDIGANDGTLLQQYRVLGYDRLLTVGWEPATNLYTQLRPHAQVLFPEFFRMDEVWGPNMQARIVTSVAMFYDLDDPHQFVESVGKILHKDGVWVIQQAYLGDMLRTTGVDNVVHEHLEYYHLRPLQYLLRQHGMEVTEVDHRTINAGSFRTYVHWAGRRVVQASVGLWEEQEAGYCADPASAWQGFTERAILAREELAFTVDTAHRAGQIIDLYGASTKGSTLAQWCGLTSLQIRQAWERSPAKVGRYFSATGIPIVSEEQGRADPPDILLALIWQFREGLVQREADYLRAGGRLLFPLPVVEEVRG